jgi:hypothetical protein
MQRLINSLRVFLLKFYDLTLFSSEEWQRKQKKITNYCLSISSKGHLIYTDVVQTNQVVGFDLMPDLIKMKEFIRPEAQIVLPLVILKPYAENDKEVAS